jgi:hypothetical protein
MYEIDGKTYYKITFESDAGFVKLYTAKILNEDDYAILILTVKQEELILRKTNIVRMIRVSEMYDDGKEY